LVFAKPKMEFHVSAVLAFLEPRPAIRARAAAVAALAAELAPQTLVSWSEMRFVMMSGLRASS